MRRFLGNWQASGIVTKRTGLWFNIIDGRDNSLSGIGVDRPDVVGNSHVANQTLSQWFNPAAFQLSPLGTFGNSGRNNRGSRRLHVRHRGEAQLYGHGAPAPGNAAEAFNVLNHPVYTNPRSSLADANIGRILAAQDPRIMQFALKYVF